MAWIGLTIIDLYKNITKVSSQVLAKLIIGALIY
jgi:hypothetical protein